MLDATSGSIPKMVARYGMLSKALDETRLRRLYEDDLMTDPEIASLVATELGLEESFHERPTMGLSVAQTTFYVEQDLDRAMNLKPVMEALERLVVAGSLRKCIGIVPAVSLSDKTRKGRVALDRYLPNS